MRDIRVPRTLLGIVVGSGARPRRRADAGAHPQPARRPRPARRQRRRRRRGRDRAVARRRRAPPATVWFAFLGAALASVAVYVIGSAGRGGATPVRLALAGTALTAALTAVIYGVALTDPRLLQQYNFWSVGALGGRGARELEAVVPFIVVGLRDRAGARALPERARARRRLRPRARRPRRPHADRRRGRDHAAVRRGDRGGRADLLPRPDRPARRRARSCGPDQRWVLAYSAVLGAALLLVADVIGRVLVRPSELQAGVMLAVIGAPVFIALVRRKRIAAAVSAGTMRPTRGCPGASCASATASRCGSARGRSPSALVLALLDAGAARRRDRHGRVPDRAGRRGRRAARRRATRRTDVHRARAAAAAGALRARSSAPRSASPARSSSR